jgi:Flp pilus assembly protein TadG
MRPLRSLWRDTRGASAAEFTLVLPVTLFLIFGVIDAGRMLWEWNQAEKATQAGVRVAVATQVIPAGLGTYKYVGQTVGGVTYAQGDPIQASGLDLITCTKPTTAVTCSCGTNPPGACSSTNAAGFNAIAARMKGMMPTVADSNVVVEYRGSGLGYAGDPGGMDVSPLITVKLTGMTFRPLVLMGLVAVTMPDFRATLTAEDSLGTLAN